MRWQQKVSFHGQGPKLEFRGRRCGAYRVERVDGGIPVVQTGYFISREQLAFVNRTTTHHMRCCRILDDKPLHLALSSLSLSANHPPEYTPPLIQTSCSSNPLYHLSNGTIPSISFRLVRAASLSHRLESAAVAAPDSNFSRRALSPGHLADRGKGISTAAPSLLFLINP
jgi:hypothetical protein